MIGSQDAGPENTGERPRTRGGFADIGIRSISSLVMAAAALAAAWYGGLFFHFLAVLIALLIFYEWIRMVPAGRHPRHWAVPAIVFGVLSIALLAGHSSVTVWVILVLGFASSLVSGWFLDRDFSGAAGFAYAGLSAVSLAFLRDDDHAGLLAILFLFAVVWATDILAYFCGRLAGGPKLAPAISPGKTWSGALGGTAGGVLAALAFALLAGLRPTPMLAFAALLLSIFAQIGDLFESAMKRRYGVKDSSHLIPGHGGVMDRVDGLVAAALALYLIGGLVAGFDLPAHGLFQP